MKIPKVNKKTLNYNNYIPIFRDELLNKQIKKRSIKLCILLICIFIIIFIFCFLILFFELNNLNNYKALVTSLTVSKISINNISMNEEFLQNIKKVLKKMKY